MGSRVDCHGDGTATIWLDRDPINGDDKNSGKKGEGPVKTLRRQAELLSKVPALNSISLAESWEKNVAFNE